MTTAESFPSNDYKLPPDIQAMIDAGNKSRALGVAPEVVEAEFADDKSYAARPSIPTPTSTQETTRAADSIASVVEQGVTVAQGIVDGTQTPRVVLGSAARQNFGSFESSVKLRDHKLGANPNYSTAARRRDAEVSDAETQRREGHGSKGAV
jgi:hypothetical protein